jgi:hypothetical protein
MEALFDLSDKVAVSKFPDRCVGNILAQTQMSSGPNQRWDRGRIVHNSGPLLWQRVLLYLDKALKDYLPSNSSLIEVTSIEKRLC